MIIVGDRSYAFYLWHWPVLILAEHLAGHELSASAKLVLVAGRISPLVCLVRVGREPDPPESPWPEGDLARRRGLHGRRPRHRRGRPSPGSIARSGASKARLAAPVVPLRFGSSEASTAGGALPAVIAAVEAARRGAPIPSPLTPPLGQLKGSDGKYGLSKDCIGRNRSSVVRTKICRLGNRSSRKLVVLMGDSHALMWLPAVLGTARHDGSAVIPLVRLGCTPAKWTSRFGNDACHEWYRWAISQVSRLRPRVTLVGGSIGELPGPFTRAGIDGVVMAAHTLRNRAVVVSVIRKVWTKTRSTVCCRRTPRWRHARRRGLRPRSQPTTKSLGECRGPAPAFFALAASSASSGSVLPLSAGRSSGRTAAAI